MSDGFYTKENLSDPAQIFREILRKAAKSEYSESSEYTQIFYRALVLAVDVEGSKLENPAGSGELEQKVGDNSFNVKARVGPDNPPNSIKARILTDGIDKFATDDNLRVFWPFFPETISVPIKPGEHVYVIFEDSGMTHGLWVTKVPGHLGVNYALGSSFYKENSTQRLTGKFSDTAAASENNEDKKYNKNEDAAETKSGNKISSLFT